MKKFVFGTMKDDPKYFVTRKVNKDGSIALKLYENTPELSFIAEQENPEVQDEAFKLVKDQYKPIFKIEFPDLENLEAFIDILNKLRDKALIEMAQEVAIHDYEIKLRSGSVLQDILQPNKEINEHLNKPEEDKW